MSVDRKIDFFGVDLIKGNVHDTINNITVPLEYASKMVYISLLLYHRHHSFTEEEKLLWSQYWELEDEIKRCSEKYKMDLEGLSFHVKAVLPMIVPCHSPLPMITKVIKDYNDSGHFDVETFIGYYSIIMAIIVVYNIRCAHLIRNIPFMDGNSKKRGVKSLKYWDDVKTVFEKILKRERSAGKQRGRDNEFAIAFENEIYPILKRNDAWKTEVYAEVDFDKAKNMSLNELIKEYPKIKREDLETIQNGYDKLLTDMKEAKYRLWQKHYKKWKSRPPKESEEYLEVISKEFAKFFENTLWKKVDSIYDPSLKDSYEPLPESDTPNRIIIDENVMNIYNRLFQYLTKDATTK